MGLFDGMFGPPLTPEEEAAAKKRLAEQRLAAGKRLEAVLPSLKAAQLALRDAASYGHSSYHYDKARSHLARLIDDVETSLARDE